MIKAGTFPTISNITEILQLAVGTVTEDIITLCANIYENSTIHNVPYANTNASTEFTSVAGPHTTKDESLKVPGCYHIFEPTNGLSGYLGQNIHLGRRVRDHANGHHTSTTNFISIIKPRGNVTLFIIEDANTLPCDVGLFITILEQHLFFVLQPIVNIRFIASPGLVVSGTRISSEGIKVL